MGRGYKNRISGKVKKNSKICSIFFWAEGLAGIWAEIFFRRDVWAEFWPEKFCPGVHQHFFFKKSRFFYFRSTGPERRPLTGKP
jgi:hypothetical protein